MEQVILVDKNDKEVGFSEKIEAHKKALLHRAVSILIFNKDGEFLIQRRASKKYHCPGLWSNSCCTHPLPNEDIKEAVKRRLFEEMGFVTEMNKVHEFIYKTKLENGLTEYEYDHIFFGVYEGDIKINKDEVEEYKWIKKEELFNDINKNPKKYTYWFKEILKELKLI